MDIQAVISQLKTYAPIFSNRVAGAAEFAQSIEKQVFLTLPAAYIIPTGDVAESNNEGTNCLFQRVRESITISIELDNSTNRQGTVAITSVETVKYAVFAALLNWRIDPNNCPRGLEYDGAGLGTVDRGRLWWEMRFVLERIITDDDGFHITGDTLNTIETDIQITDTNAVPLVTPDILINTVTNLQD